MKRTNKIQCLILVVVLTIIPLLSLMSELDSVPQLIKLRPNTQPFEISQESTDLNLTWTSRTQVVPLKIQNYSSAVGDHVVLNATWNDLVNGGNVTNSSLIVTDGFSFSTTRPLKQIGYVGWFDWPSYELFDWIEISGFSRGDQVNITAYAENDCDYFAFDESTPIEDYYSDTDLLGLQMCSSANPEHGTFTWNSDSGTMYLGCLDYDNAIGNYTVDIKVGEFQTIESSCNSIIFDTYFLDNHNDTYEITAIAETDLNESYSIRFENVTINNFFAPEFTDSHIYYNPIDDRTFNISWSSTDDNADDVHFYEIWLSNNGGYSYILLERNISQSWCVWNSTDWISGFYEVRVRAYSVDVTTPNCEFDDPPYSYWPGDYTDLVIGPIDAGSHSHPPGYYTLDIELVTDSSYYFGSTGNILTVNLDFSYSLPWSVDYSVTDNGASWILGEYQPHAYSSSFEINIDGLTIGHHILLLTISDYRSDTQTCSVDVLDPTLINTNSTTTTDSGFLFQALTIGISVGSTAVIAIVIVLTIRIRQHQAMAE